MPDKPSEILVDEAVDAGLDISQYLGVWAIHEPHFMAIFEHAAGIDLAAHVRSQAGQDHTAVQASAIDSKQQGSKIAVIEMRGPLTKQGSSLSRAGSTVRMRREIRAAAKDPEVAAIVVRCDSPGGTVAGTEELAQDIARAAAQKPLWGFVEDLCASAAYHGLSQCGRVVANNDSAMVGSIGTFVCLYDSSEMAKKIGRRPVVVKAGEFKGAGIPGTEITEAQTAEWQKIVDGMQEGFTAAVRRGRNMPLAQARQLADGKIHLAADAVGLNLIDAVQGWDDFLADLWRQTSKQKGRAMSTDLNTLQSGETLQPAGATLEQLEASIPEAGADFYMAQLKAKHTLDQAKDAWLAEQSRRLKAAEEKAAEAEARAKAAEEKTISRKSAAAGTVPLGTRSTEPQETEEFGDAVEQFNAKVEEAVRGGASRQSAVFAVSRRHPELHQAYLMETNPGRRAQRLLTEKFE